MQMLIRKGAEKLNYFKVVARAMVANCGVLANY